MLSHRQRFSIWPAAARCWAGGAPTGGSFWCRS